MYGSGFNIYPAYKSTGLLAGLVNLKNKINFGAILTNAQKTLNVVNQALPLVYQVKPIINNAKTVFKVISAVKSDDSNKKMNYQNTNNFNQTEKKDNKKYNTEPVHYNNNSLNEPKFFI